MKDYFTVDHIYCNGEFLPFLLFHSVDSTNLVAKNLLDAGFNPPFAILAAGQRKGYGRYRRRWESPLYGGIYMSLVSSAVLRKPQLATLAAAVAVKETLLRLLPNADVSIRYPNDVLLGGRKVSGILAELRESLIIGLGLNLRKDLLPPHLEEATALDSSYPSPPRFQVVKRLLEDLSEKLGLLASGQEGAIIEEVEFSGVVGARVRVTDRGGTEIIGVAEKVDGEGALLLRTDGGELHRIIAADVQLLRMEGRNYGEE